MEFYITYLNIHFKLFNCIIKIVTVYMIYLIYFVIVEISLLLSLQYFSAENRFYIIKQNVFLSSLHNKL